MKKSTPLIICILIIFGSSFHSSAQNVYIPDANFKAALIGNSAINTNGDTAIQVSEATTYSGAIQINGLFISDLTGISSFVHIYFLGCYLNNLSSLDVSANTDLVGLICSSNNLTSLNVSANTALNYLDCSGNQLTSLNVSANNALNYLDCSGNQLTSLSVSANTALTYLDCSQNPLTSLNVSANTALTSLYCESNQLTSLNLSANIDLVELFCRHNYLTSLNVNANTALTQFNCSFNQLTSLNVNANTALDTLSCGYNQLTSLNVSAITALISFFCLYNPNLFCIQVADVAAADTNSNWYIDPIASYSLNCGSSAVSDIAANAFSFFPNPASNTLNITGLQKDDEYKMYNTIGQLILSGKCINTRDKMLDIQALANSIYSIQLTRNNYKYISKFVKE